MLLEIKDLTVSVDGQIILESLNLAIDRGQTHVIVGPNGAGKSTLFNVLMGHPKYHVESGTVLYDGEDLLAMPTDERARKGIFLSFQNPEEVPGLKLGDFLRAAQGEMQGKMPGLLKFRRSLAEKMAELQMDESYVDRYLNVGFSGGEKKKNEILQLNILQPTLALLDETDSGLDVDAVKLVSEGIDHFRNEDNAVLLITHHRALLRALTMDQVHVIINGRLVRSGSQELFERIQEEGFAWLMPESERVAAGVGAADADASMLEGELL